MCHWPLIHPLLYTCNTTLAQSQNLQCACKSIFFGCASRSTSYCVSLTTIVRPPFTVYSFDATSPVTWLTSPVELPVVAPCSVAATSVNVPVTVETVTSCHANSRVLPSEGYVITSVGSCVMLGESVQTHLVGLSLTYNVGVVEKRRDLFVWLLSLEQCGRLFSECIVYYTVTVTMAAAFCMGRPTVAACIN